MEKSVKELVEAQREFFNSGATRPVAFRKAMLKKLKRAILTREKDILAAVHQDLGKSDFEAFTTEIILVLKEIDIMIPTAYASSCHPGIIRFNSRSCPSSGPLPEGTPPS